MELTLPPPHTHTPVKFSTKFRVPESTSVLETKFVKSGQNITSEQGVLLEFSRFCQRFQLSHERSEIVKQHEAAKDYINRLKEELVAAEESRNTAVQVSNKNIRNQCRFLEGLQTSALCQCLSTLTHQDFCTNFAGKGRNSVQTGFRIGKNGGVHGTDTITEGES